MTQATGLSGRDGKVEISTDGVTFTDISGFANSWSVDGGDRMIGEAFTFDGDGPAVALGKKNRFTIAFSFLYTEGATDPAKALWDAYNSSTVYYVRLSPTGGSTNEFTYTSGAGYFLQPLVPDNDASSPDLLTIETEFSCGTLTRATA
jgi:hypothetical protein